MICSLIPINYNPSQYSKTSENFSIKGLTTWLSFRIAWAMLNGFIIWMPIKRPTSSITFLISLANHLVISARKKSVTLLFITVKWCFKHQNLREINSLIFSIRNTYLLSPYTLYTLKKVLGSNYSVILICCIQKLQEQSLTMLW